ncbi:hypothetical protein Sjap_004398 [Stephania japonica]|uniref:C2H2-type domain-containing protein n=1 Tax=Stephania japonica TaxID=461633 RepID=A0AAP0K4F5_9MAGN
MAADLGLLSTTQHQKLVHQSQGQQQQEQPNPNLTATTGAWMWNARQAQDDDDSWEVRAFAEDTGNIMGTTWPPRSYSCTFCRREFRSAQALGGHMNVHRRDRARLRHSPTGSSAADPASSPSSSSALFFPTQDFVSNGGLCLLYPFPNPNNASVFNPIASMNNGCADSPSPTFLSVSPFPTNDLIMPSCSPHNFSIPTSVQYACHSIVENTYLDVGDDNNKKASFEELDLELRLGSKPSP